MPDHDLIIVGGGPAGLSTLLHLHRVAPALAERTLLLERDTYPREKYCAGAVGGRGLKVLERLGVPLAVPAVPISRVSIRFPGHLTTVTQAGFGQVVRRLEFDHSLARAALARGLKVKDGVTVRSVAQERDGVRVHLASGESLTARAVVGADGVGGVVRRSAGVGGGHLRAQVIELDTEPVAGDPERDTIHFDVEDTSLAGYAWDFPTIVDGAPMICRGIYVLPAIGRENLKARLRTYLATRGLDINRYRLKPFGERGFERGEPVSRPGMILVGEAAGIDIATGEGIAQALQFGALAAGYLERAFHRGRYDFADWGRVVERSGLGAGLFARTVAYRAFYFHRAWSVDFFRRNPGILGLYAAEFAGRLPSPRLVAGVLARTRPGDVRGGLRALRWAAEHRPEHAADREDG